MFARFTKSLYLTKGEKAFVLAYAAVIAMTAGITMMVMSGLEGPGAIPDEATLYVFWAILSGAISGGIALYLARGWLGNLGAMGVARAFVGSVAVALIAAVAAGTLIMPLYGTFYAPVLLITAFISKPWLAMAWFAVTIGAHYMMIVLTEERAFGTGRSARRSATERLSTLSRAQLYNRD
jgi:hypothetical protein